MLTVHSAATPLLPRETLWVEVALLKPLVVGEVEMTQPLLMEVKLLGAKTLVVAVGRALHPRFTLSSSTTTQLRSRYDHGDHKHDCNDYDSGDRGKGEAPSVDQIPLRQGSRTFQRGRLPCCRALVTYVQNEKFACESYSWVSTNDFPL